MGLILFCIAIVAVIALFSGASLVIFAKSGEQETFGGLIVLVAGLIFALSGALLVAGT
jgi:hypothetical protein